MNILCFGDSNTWGYKPDKTGRFDEKTRWTGLLQQKLGPEYHIIEEGTKKANIKANETLKRVRAAMKINYFEEESFVDEMKTIYHNIYKNSSTI